MHAQALVQWHHCCGNLQCVGTAEAAGGIQEQLQIQLIAGVFNAMADYQQRRRESEISDVKAWKVESFDTRQSSHGKWTGSWQTRLTVLELDWYFSEKSKHASAHLSARLVAELSHDALVKSLPGQIVVTKGGRTDQIRPDHTHTH